MAFNHKELLKEIQDQYLENDDNRAWIIAFSGGKDSTTLLQLVWYAPERLQQDEPKRFEGYPRPIHVICNNTLVENPQILKFVEKQLEAIQKAAAEQGLPFSVTQTTPKLEDSFWINLIGKGYPAPNNMFRWCTERLKISPTTKFIQDKISTYGEVIILLGTRSDESSTRAASIKRHEVKGSRLRNHVLPNAKVYDPIKDMTTDEVWMYLQQITNPWTKEKNKELVTLYLNGSGGDCPLVMDISTPSCGNSRFGCWVCTVVNRDKSMEALISNGEDWMIPLMQIRDFLSDTINRDHPEYAPEKYRMSVRRNGAKTLSEDGEIIHCGPYWPAVRKYILEELLKAQKIVQKHEADMKLISFQELVGIQVQWHRDFIFEYSVAEIYNKIFETSIVFEDEDDHSRIERETLQESCKTNPKDIRLIQNLLKAQRNKTLLIKKIGLQNDLEAILDENIDPKFTTYYDAYKKNNT